MRTTHASNPELKEDNGEENQCAGYAIDRQV